MAESIDNPKVLGIILGMAGMIVFLVLGFMVFTGYQPDVKIDDTAFDQETMMDGVTAIVRFHTVWGQATDRMAFSGNVRWKQIGVRGAFLKFSDDTKELVIPVSSLICFEIQKEEDSISDQETSGD